MKSVTLNIDWRDYQAETLRFILSKINEKTQSIFTLCSPRQCGKTTLSESLLLYFAVNNFNSFSIFVSPTFKQARKVFNELRKAIENSPIVTNCNESQLEINFYNDSKIVFCSGESSIGTLQGYTVKKGILIFDEAAYLQPEIFQALFPTTDVHKCPILLASTPRFREGTFYDYYTRGLEGYEDLYTFDWKGHTLLTPSKLEFYKETLPENVFKNYYLGEFCDFGNGCFGYFKECISNKFERTGRYYFGIDFGAGNNGDDTAISVLNDLKQQCDLVYFNDLDETQTIDKIVETIQKWRPIKVTVELNSIGRIFYGLLRKKIEKIGIDTNLRGINTTNESKQRQVQKLQVAIQNKEITFLDNAKQTSELNNYQISLSKTGKLVYNAATGYHDDLVIATMIAFDSLNSGNYYFN